MSDHPAEPQAPESRERLLWPIAIPVVALVVIGAVLYLFSRILLRVTPTAATLAASRPHVSGASLVSMVGGVAGIAMFAGGLALILGQPAEELQPVVVALAAPVGAINKGFEPNELSAPANYPFTIAFTNDDVSGGAGVQHNVVVTQEETTATAGAITVGTPITGPAEVDVPLTGLAQGSYFFFCEFHPTSMTGTLTIAGPPPAPGAPQGPVVTATDPTAFSPNTIELPAGQPGTITFDNEDPGITHNLDVYSDKDYTQSIAKTPDVTGVSSGQVALPALEAGTYYFRCDFHPVMTGTLTVSGGGGGGGAGGATPSGPPPSEGPSPSPGG